MISFNTGEQYEDENMMVLDRPITLDEPQKGLEGLKKKAGDLHGGDIVTKIPYSERIGSGDPPSENIDDRRGNISAKQIFSPNVYGFSSEFGSPETKVPRQATIHQQMIQGADQQARTANHRVESGELNPVEGVHVDLNHHVPLVASALTDDNGQMYGVAIDHRVNVPPEYLPHLIEHERSENSYMNDLKKDGYSSQDAYHKAHDWATERESAAVIGEFGREGQDKYKQFFRDAASVASEPTDRDRHPDAHTTRHGLDESELNFPKPANDNDPVEMQKRKIDDLIKKTYPMKLAANVPANDNDILEKYRKMAEELKAMRREKTRTILDEVLGVDNVVPFDKK